MSTQPFIFGRDAKLYFGDAEDELSTLTEVGNCQDLTVNMDAGEVDITTRSSGGWRGKAQGLKECSLEFTMLWKSGDAAFEAIKNAFLTSGLVELAALTGGKTVAGSEGPKGSFSITSFRRTEPIEEGIAVAVTASLSVFDEWVKVSGGA